MPPKKRAAARAAPLVADPSALLEAHVAFELARWKGKAARASLREEVDALLAWLDTVTVGDVAPAERTARAVAAVLDDLEVTDELVGVVVDVLVAGRTALVDAAAPVADLVEPADLDAFVDAVAGLEDLRGRWIGALTESAAYHRLVAHVLYHGIKGYVLTENAIARKVPGAQSLIRLGQRGLSSAAPGFGQAADRQLGAFIQANIGETLRDSRRFLERTLSADSLHELVDEVWRSLATSTSADVAAAVEEGDLDALTVAAAPLVRSALASGHVGSVLERHVAGVLEQYAEVSVAALLTDLGLEAAALAGHASELLAHGVHAAYETGYLEERVRARLEPFYATLG